MEGEGMRGEEKGIQGGRKRKRKKLVNGNGSGREWE
jgi:hypothetical protein